MLQKDNGALCGNVQIGLHKGLRLRFIRDVRATIWLTKTARSRTCVKFLVPVGIKFRFDISMGRGIGCFIKLSHFHWVVVRG